MAIFISDLNIIVVTGRIFITYTRRIVEDLHTYINEKIKCCF